MDKISIYKDIQKRLLEVNDLTRTGEGKFVVGIICQRIQDCMGIDRADTVRVYLPIEGKSRVNGKRIRKQTATHQQLALKWFLDNEHYVWADLIDVEPTWITHLLKTKAGVAL